MPLRTEHAARVSEARRPAIAPLRLLVVSVVAVDVLVMLGNAVHLTVNDRREPYDPVFSQWVWNGNLDGSYAEMLGAAQLVGAIVVLLFLWRRQRAPVYAAWALVFAAIVVDDTFRVHERAGAALVRAVDLPAVASLRAQDLGELAVWAAAAVFLGPLLAVAYLRAPAGARRDSRILVGLMLLLAAFAVLIDMVHIAVAPYLSPAAGHLLTLTETGGELGVMTLILIAVSAMASRSAGAVGGGPRTGDDSPPVPHPSPPEADARAAAAPPAGAVPRRR